MQDEVGEGTQAQNENNLRLCGVTGVEDLLQEDVVRPGDSANMGSAMSF